MKFGPAGVLVVIAAATGCATYAPPAPNPVRFHCAVPVPLGPAAPAGASLGLVVDDQRARPFVGAVSDQSGPRAVAFDSWTPPSIVLALDLARLLEGAGYRVDREPPEGSTSPTLAVQLLATETRTPLTLSRSILVGEVRFDGSLSTADSSSAWAVSILGADTVRIERPDEVALEQVLNRAYCKALQVFADSLPPSLR